MDRVWLLTWTTYGTWLPGDDRGHVSNIGTQDGTHHRMNTPGTPYDSRQPGLQLAAREKLVGQPIFLTASHAKPLLEQFLETAQFRGWTPLAIAIMANHVHILVGVQNDPEPASLLRDFKSYGSRHLNEQFGKPLSGTWWTEGGSKRKKSDNEAVRRSKEYVRKQSYPLVVWVSDHDTLLT